MLMKKTALLVMDYQPEILSNYGDQVDRLLDNAKKLLAAARSAGAPVIFVRVAFRPGYPEASSRNKMFAAIKGSGRLLIGKEGSDVHPALEARENEVVVTKHRVGAFTDTDLAAALRACDADHLVLAGVATSGVVLSTLRFAADMDYALTVVRDACADGDEETHRVLMEKVFPKQADVIDAATAAKLFRQ